MKALLLYPRYPKTYWSADRLLDLLDAKAVIPPLGLITVAALLPEDWEIRFYDRNVTPETNADWEWCDLIILSAMIVQCPDFLDLISKGVQLGKKVAVGGPLPTSQPEYALERGAHYLILDEGEITIPLFLQALAEGKPKGIFRADEKPDVTLSPIPRFELLEQDKYVMMAIQFSRGCPFNCEFCDIITLYGRKPRTKEPQQVLAELQALYDRGFRGPIFLVDDNFIGNQRNVKRLLRELIPWMKARHYPFTFQTEASVNLAEDTELLDLMIEAGFFRVFIGIETPDEDSLRLTRKSQNVRNPLLESCQTIMEAGLSINAGFIIGFDGERSGAGARIQAFVEMASIPQAMIGILQALANTALWNRLQQENRLITNSEELVFGHQGDQNSLMNFVPTRPIAEIGKEYVQALETLYDPKNYLQRCFRHCMKIVPNPYLKQYVRPPSPLKGLKLAVSVCWIQGIVRSETRMLFWQQLWTILWQRPQLLNLYIESCGWGEHFLEYRELARERIKQQLGYDPLSSAGTPPDLSTLVELKSVNPALYTEDKLGSYSDPESKSATARRG
jgi:radical SAM superfamily enzyme YgiQ (UPF0313 family)